MSRTVLPSQRTRTTETNRREMSLRTLVPFFALSFGLSWGVIAVLIIFPAPVEAVFGEMGYTNPLFILAVYAPGFAGAFLVWRHYGLRGLGSFFRRLTLWRMPLVWWLVLLVGMPAVFYAGAVLKGTISDPFPFAPWYGVLPALALALFIGPIEEFGWRGVALPLLQRRFAPLWSALILGSIVALWHLPAFFLGGTPQSSWSIAPFLIGVVAISVILTAMFNAAAGSLLVAALFHFQMNGPAWPDAQPWDTLVFVAVAAAIVLLNRRAMLARDGAVTGVLMPHRPEDARVTPRSAR